MSAKGGAPMRASTAMPARDGDLLSAALKAIRRHRGKTATETASAMNMALRTYERFEAGETRLNVDHIHRFASATDSDPYAILLAVALGSPELARRCADNKLATILTIALQKYDVAMGDRIQRQDTRTLIALVTEMFDKLIEDGRNLQSAETWLESGNRDLRSNRPKPGR